MSLAKAYLILYNSAQLLGWSFILWETAYGLIVSKDASNVYESVGYAVRKWHFPITFAAGVVVLSGEDFQEGS